VRILLDECVPWPLSQFLLGHQCSNPRKCGWAGVKNGDLLRLAEPNFDLFITADQNLRYQQNISGRKLAILELPTNDWHAIRSDADAIQKIINGGDIMPESFIQHIVKTQ